MSTETIAFGTVVFSSFLILLSMTCIFYIQKWINVQKQEELFFIVFGFSMKSRHSYPTNFRQRCLEKMAQVKIKLESTNGLSYTQRQERNVYELEQMFRLQWALCQQLKIYDEGVYNMIKKSLQDN